MRLWSLHPRYLDSRGLVAVWRESLLAQKVLQGKTKGYRYHPHLTRFRLQDDPLAAIAAYLRAIFQEAGNRQYKFDGSKIAGEFPASPIPVTRGQVTYEWEHLRKKLSDRDPARLLTLTNIVVPDLHPLFRLVDGERESWEITDRA